MDAILLQKLDLGLISPTRHYEGLYYLFESTIEYVCLLPNSHELADSPDRIDFVELCNTEPEVLVPQNAFQFSRDAVSIDSLTSNAPIASPSGPVIASTARAAGLVSVVDPFTARVACLQGSLVAKPLLQQPQYPVAIVTRGVDALSSVGAEMADSLVAQIQDFHGLWELGE